MNSSFRPYSSKKGFTLVELLVVLVILSVLAAAVIPSYLGFIDKSQETVCLSNRHSAYIESYVYWIFDYKADLSEIKEKYEGTCPKGGAYRYQQTETELNILCTYHKDKGILTDMDKIINDANAVTKDAGFYPSRESIIEALVKQKGLQPVGDDVLDKTGNKGKELYWRPYYLGSSKKPQTILFGAPGNSGHNGWAATVLYVNGTVYKVAPGKTIADFHKYDSFDTLKEYLNAPGSGFTRVN